MVTKLAILLMIAHLILLEAEEHQLAYMKWRHNSLNPQLGVCRLLSQDLGYLADEREHCPHCK